jgi:hypothetical protein
MGVIAVFQAKSGDDILDGVDGEQCRHDFCGWWGWSAHYFSVLFFLVVASRAILINQVCQETGDVPGDCAD